jgi:hypothetical protein
MNTRTDRVRTAMHSSGATITPVSPAKSPWP